MSTRVCFGNWYHHDFYCAYNLIWFQRDHHIRPAFCSCFTNFLQMMSKWSSLLLDSGSSTPFLPCGYKAIHQKLFWDLPEIIHLSQFLILFFYGQEKPKKKKNLWVAKIFDVWSWIFTEPFLPTNSAVCLECDHTEPPTQPRLSARAVIRHIVFHFFLVPSIPLRKEKLFWDSLFRRVLLIEHLFYVLIPFPSAVSQWYKSILFSFPPCSCGSITCHSHLCHQFCYKLWSS